MKWRWLFATACLCATLTTACGKPSASPSTTHPAVSIQKAPAHVSPNTGGRVSPASNAKVPREARASTVPYFDHVVVVMEENHAYSDVIGSPDAPFLNAAARQGRLFSNAYAVSHPSQPNYVAVFYGQTKGVTSDSCPQHLQGPDLASQLLARGLRFTGYEEDLPGVGSTVCWSGNYARKHNPWVDDSSLPATVNQPFRAFPSDYSKLPAVAFVVPNLQHDMHDGTVAQGDAWAKANLGGYLEWARTHNSLLVFWWDEDDNSSGNHVPLLMAGAHVAPGITADRVTHYTVLHLLESANGLAPLGNAASAAIPTGLWISSQQSGGS